MKRPRFPGPPFASFPLGNFRIAMLIFQKDASACVCET
jgi:hypothetical protein